jgi:hypothetical protein
MSKPDIHTPLKPAAFQILLALADGPAHGYAAMQAVREGSGGRVRVSTGSFYRHLSTLMRDGLVDEATGPAGDDPGAAPTIAPRRRGGRSWRASASARRPGRRARRAEPSSRRGAPDVRRARPADRVFDALLRACPEHVRARFAAGMRYAFCRDLEIARGKGPGALAAFWTFTIVDILHLALRERTRGGPAMRGSLTIDWRDAWRSLRAAPLVTGFAVLSLALGMGGVTALFAILNSLALKPLPVRDPAGLVILADDSWTNPIWENVRDRRQTFAADAFAWATDRFNLSPTAAADMVEGLYASGGMFEMLGVPAALGRTFTERDDAAVAARDGHVAVISYAMWQRRYAGAPDVIGRGISIERVPFTIIGVTPHGFFGPDVGRSFDIADPSGTEPLVRRDGTTSINADLVDEHHGPAERADGGEATALPVDAAADPRAPAGGRRTCAPAT